MFNPWERRYWSQLGFHVFPWCNGYNNNPCNIYYKSYNVNGRRAWVAKLLNLMTDLNYHHSDDNSSHHMSVGRLVIMIGYRKYILEVLAIIPHHWLVNLPCIYIYIICLTWPSSCDVPRLVSYPQYSPIITPYCNQKTQDLMLNLCPYSWIHANDHSVKHHRGYQKMQFCIHLPACSGLSFPGQRRTHTSERAPGTVGLAHGM